MILMQSWHWTQILNLTHAIHQRLFEISHHTVSTILNLHSLPYICAVTSVHNITNTQFITCGADDTGLINLKKKKQNVTELAVCNGENSNNRFNGPLSRMSRVSWHQKTAHSLTSCLHTTHTHTHNRFTALWKLSGTTRVSRYQKKHSLHTTCVINFLHFLWSIASSLKELSSLAILYTTHF